MALLSSLRLRLRRLGAFDGLADLALAGLIALCVSFALDYLLVLPLAVRSLFLVAGAGASGPSPIHTQSRWATDLGLPDVLPRFSVLLLEDPGAVRAQSAPARPSSEGPR